MKLTEHSVEEILQHPKIQHWFKQFLIEFNKDATGSSNRVAMLYLMTEAPQLDLGEVTDKGNLNQSNILKKRSNLVDALYSKVADHALIIRIPTLNN